MFAIVACACARPVSGLFLDDFPDQQVDPDELVRQAEILAKAMLRRANENFLNQLANNKIIPPPMSRPRPKPTGKKRMKPTYDLPEEFRKLVDDMPYTQSFHDFLANGGFVESVKKEMEKVIKPNKRRPNAQYEL